jgi:hypothetical protein
MTLNPIPETTAHIINGGTNMTVRANIERAIGQPLPAVGQFNPWTSGIPKLPLDQYTGEIRRDCYDIAREAGRRAASLGLVGMQLDWDVIRPIRSFADWLIRKSVSSDPGKAPIEFLPAKHSGEYRAAMLAGATHGVVIKRERTRSTLLTRLHRPRHRTRPTPHRRPPRRPRRRWRGRSPCLDLGLAQREANQGRRC